jgi:hypothetical protein
LFLKLVCFFTGLAGRFYNFELTQNREKTRNALNFVLRIKLGGIILVVKSVV